MALKLGPCHHQLISNPHLSFRTKTPALTVKAAVKKSPKRLKYSSPSFTKDVDELLYVEVDPSFLSVWSYLFTAIVCIRRYAIVCDLKCNSAIDRLRRIKNIQASKPLSTLCRSFQDIDTYTTGFPRGGGQGLSNIFRAVKQCLPGPYTFILTASKSLPKSCTRYGTTTSKLLSRKNVGVRIPDDAVCQAILEKMSAPLLSTSVRSPKENEWIIDPVVIADVYGPEGLDFVVDAGVRMAEPSTVVDMTASYPRIIRQGKGPKQHWMVADEDPEDETEIA
nr:PREDICTED: uncharacterized protein YciO [Daucus carota subsp. sativus]